MMTGMNPLILHPPRLGRLALALTCLMGGALPTAAQANNLCAGLASYVVKPLIGGSPMDVCRLPVRWNSRRARRTPGAARGAARMNPRRPEQRGGPVRPATAPPA